MPMEHICYVSGDGLPDIRVEKELYSLGLKGFKLSFVGRVSKTIGIFESVDVKVNLVNYDIGLNRYVSLRIEPYYTWAKKRIKRVLREVKPDIVVAVNVIVGAMIHELGYPLVLDDHETYSLKALYDTGAKGFVDKLVRSRKLKLFSKYERVIGENHPVIVVTEHSLEHYRKLGAEKVLIVKNYPAKPEIEDIEFKEIECKVKRFLYIGRDISPQRVDYCRDAKYAWKQLLKYVNKGLARVTVIGDPGVRSSEGIASLGYIDHMRIYREGKDHHFGLLAIRPTPYHKCCGLNRAYIMAHLGAVLVITGTYESVLKDLEKFSLVVDKENYEESLTEVLRKAIDFDCDELNDLRRRLYKYSRSKLVWDSQDDTLAEAVREA